MIFAFPLICVAHRLSLHTHIRMFRCLCDELKERAKESTELRELRSISMTWSFASGFCSRRLSLTFRPLSMVRHGIMTFAPLKARTLAVSFPMPFVAPTISTCKATKQTCVYFFLFHFRRMPWNFEEKITIVSGRTMVACLFK